MPKFLNKNNRKNGNGKHSNKNLTRNKQRHANYKQMSSQGVLGRMELAKYEERRAFVHRYFPDEYFPCCDRGETPGRDDFKKVSGLYYRIIHHKQLQ